MRALSTLACFALSGCSVWLPPGDPPDCHRVDPSCELRAQRDGVFPCVPYVCGENNRCDPVDAERCDGFDNTCEGLVDEGLELATVAELAVDADARVGASADGSGLRLAWVRRTEMVLLEVSSSASSLGGVAFAGPVSAREGASLNASFAEGCWPPLTPGTPAQDAPSACGLGTAGGDPPAISASALFAVALTNAPAFASPSPACPADGACGGGLACVVGRCERACEDAAGCDVGEACVASGDERVCLLRCDSDASCPTGQVCGDAGVCGEVPAARALVRVGRFDPDVPRPPRVDGAPAVSNVFRGVSSPCAGGDCRASGLTIADATTPGRALLGYVSGPSARCGGSPRRVEVLELHTQAEGYLTGASSGVPLDLGASTAAGGPALSPWEGGYVAAFGTDDGTALRWVSSAGSIQIQSCGGDCRGAPEPTPPIASTDLGTLPGAVGHHLTLAWGSPLTSGDRPLLVAWFDAGCGSARLLARRALLRPGEPPTLVDAGEPIELAVVDVGAGAQPPEPAMVWRPALVTEDYRDDEERSPADEPALLGGWVLTWTSAGAAHAVHLWGGSGEPLRDDVVPSFPSGAVDQAVPFAHRPPGQPETTAFALHDRAAGTLRLARCTAP